MQFRTFCAGTSGNFQLPGAHSQVGPMSWRRSMSLVQIKSKLRLPRWSAGCPLQLQKLESASTSRANQTYPDIAIEYPNLDPFQHLYTEPRANRDWKINLLRGWVCFSPWGESLSKRAVQVEGRGFHQFEDIWNFLRYHFLNEFSVPICTDSFQVSMSLWMKLSRFIKTQHGSSYANLQDLHSMWALLELPVFISLFLHLKSGGFCLLLIHVSISDVHVTLN